jgi:uncharacterized membrane protein HdeD (DUF308 family)
MFTFAFDNQSLTYIFMKTSSKIWLAIAGILLIVLGVYCISRPAATLFTTAWLIGVFTLVSGISKLVFTFRTQAFLPNSGSRALSAILEIIVGFIFLGNNIFLAISLPVIFAMWVTIEGVIIAVNSFDYKRVGFPGWFVILLLGICGIVLGILGLRNPDVTAATLSTLIGLGVIAMGISYLFALRGINKFEKVVDGVFKNNVDEQ